MMRTIGVAVFLAATLAAMAQPGPTTASKQSLTEKPAAAAPSEPSSLQAHGIGLGTRELINFLEKGFPPGADPAKFPPKPVEKCQLAIDAMAALTRSKASEALPVLMRIAALDVPAGVGALMAEDLKHTSPEGREEYRTKALKLLQYNAVNALGLIGDPKGLPIVRGAYATENHPGARIQYALTMACLGDGSAIDYFVDVIQQANRRESAAAARAFYLATGQEFGYTENTPIRRRRQLAREYREWWKTNRGAFRLDVKAVQTRRLEPSAPVAFQPRSTRDLLKLSTYYLDVSDKLGTAEARQKLKDAGKAINAELSKTALDPMEDLDVRMEAINWYYESNRAEATPLLKKLRRDENPEIIDKVKNLLELIESGNAGQISQNK